MVTMDSKPDLSFMYYTRYVYKYLFILHVASNPLLVFLDTVLIFRLYCQNWKNKHKFLASMEYSAGPGYNITIVLVVIDFSCVLKQE